MNRSPIRDTTWQAILPVGVTLLTVAEALLGAHPVLVWFLTCLAALLIVGTIYWAIVEGDHAAERAVDRVRVEALLATAAENRAALRRKLDEVGK